MIIVPFIFLFPLLIRVAALNCWELGSYFFELTHPTLTLTLVKRINKAVIKWVGFISSLFLAIYSVRLTIKIICDQDIGILARVLNMHKFLCTRCLNLSLAVSLTVFTLCTVSANSGKVIIALSKMVRTR